MLVFIMLYIFKPIFPVATYIIQYDYIVNELCVNKDKPTLNCNGKCHLMKELAKASNDDQKENKDYKFPVFETISFLEAPFSYNLPLVFLQKAERNDLKLADLYAFNFSDAIFQPPIL